jgi:integrase/recombinase XerD
MGMNALATIERGAPQQAATDAQLIGLWLHGRSGNTRRAYDAEVARLLGHLAGIPLRDVTIGDLQRYMDALEEQGLSDATRGRAVSVVKSLFTFAQRIGYTTFNVAAPLKAPKTRDARSERILEEGDLFKMIALETNDRNRTLLRLAYAAGLRVSEVCGLVWRDLQPREEGGQVAVFGKGRKMRYVRIPASVWRDLLELRGDDQDADDPVFMSRSGGHLTPVQIWRIVKAAADRAGIGGDVSTHWLRHAHASHALDRGAPIHLVQATLGHASVATTGRYLHARPQESSSKYLAV